MGNVRGYAESMLSSGRKVEHSAGFDELGLTVAPSLQRTVEHDERFRLSVMKMARAHAAKPSALLDKREDSAGCCPSDKDSAEIAEMVHDGEPGSIHVCGGHIEIGHDAMVSLVMEPHKANCGSLVSSWGWAP